MKWKYEQYHTTSSTYFLYLSVKRRSNRNSISGIEKVGKHVTDKQEGKESKKKANKVANM